MAMMEKCAEETQELKELKDFLESIGGCITDDTLYSMRTILQGMVKMIKLYDYYREYWFEWFRNSLSCLQPLKHINRYKV